MRFSYRPVLMTVLLAMIGLSLLVLACYWQLTQNDFIHFDDPHYLTLNYHIQGGLQEGFFWAFRTTSVSNWHPLTWLSHMLDWQFFGANAGGHHWTSLILHWVSGLILSWVLFRMTGSLGRSALVSAFFLIHPLHVESVAWASERKDVLSGLFFMLGLWAYLGYVRRPCPLRYTLLIILLLLGLLSKPMLVTFPFVLLLLDWWPLRRLGNERSDWQARVMEKVPLLLLSLASSIVTFLVQQAGGAVDSLQNLPLGQRLANAVIAYQQYLIHTFWPVRLAVFYPHPGAWPFEQTLLALGVLLLITLFLLASARRRPYAVMGWFWYIGTLIPVIGIVQVGAQAMADRYTYLPLIGIFIAMVWGLGDLFEKWKKIRAGKFLAVTILAVFTILTHWQVGFWKNSETLFSRALEVTKGNFPAHNILGFALVDQGRYDEAEAHYREAMRINPAFMPAYNNLGAALLQQGRLGEAESLFAKALTIKPGDASVLFNQGQVYSQRRQWNNAVEAYRAALEGIKDNPMIYNNLGLALINQGDLREAEQAFREAIKLWPGHAAAHNNLAMLLIGQGRRDEAEVHFRMAIDAEPRFANAHYRLGLLLIDEGRTREGEAHLRLAREIAPDIERISNSR